MFKKNANPNPAPKTERTHRIAKVGIVGVAVALALSVTPLFSSTSTDAATGFGPSACIEAAGFDGEFVSQVGGCREGGMVPEPSEEPSTEPVPDEDATYRVAVASKDSTGSRFEVVESTASNVEYVWSGQVNYQYTTPEGESRSYQSRMELGSGDSLEIRDGNAVDRKLKDWMAAQGADGKARINERLSIVSLVAYPYRDGERVDAIYGRGSGSFSLARVHSEAGNSTPWIYS